MTFASGVSGNVPTGANFVESPGWSISTSSAAVSEISPSSSANKHGGSCVRPCGLAFIFSPHSSPESAQEECFHGLARSQNPADFVYRLRSSEIFRLLLSALRPKDQTDPRCLPQR